MKYSILYLSTQDVVPYILHIFFYKIRYCTSQSKYSEANKNTNIIIIIRVFCRRAGPSLQIQESRSQFCSKAGLPLHTQEPIGCCFTRDKQVRQLPVAFRTHSLSLSLSLQHLNRLKRSEKIPGAPAWRSGDGFGQLGSLDFTEIHHRG